MAKLAFLVVVIIFLVAVTVYTDYSLTDILAGVGLIGMTLSFQHNDNPRLKTNNSMYNTADTMYLSESDLPVTRNGWLVDIAEPKIDKFVKSFVAKMLGKHATKNIDHTTIIDAVNVWDNLDDDHAYASDLLPALYRTMIYMSAYVAQVSKTSTAVSVATVSHFEDITGSLVKVYRTDNGRYYAYSLETGVYSGVALDINFAMMLYNLAVEYITYYDSLAWAIEDMIKDRNLPIMSAWKWSQDYDNTAMATILLNHVLDNR